MLLAEQVEISINIFNPNFDYYWLTAMAFRTKNNNDIYYLLTAGTYDKILSNYKTTGIHKTNVNLDDSDCSPYSLSKSDTKVYYTQNAFWLNLETNLKSYNCILK